MLELGNIMFRQCEDKMEIYTADCPVKKGKYREIKSLKQNLVDESVHGHRGGASEGSGCPRPDSFHIFPLNLPPQLQLNTESSV